MERWLVEGKAGLTCLHFILCSELSAKLGREYGRESTDCHYTWVLALPLLDVTGEQALTPLSLFPHPHNEEVVLGTFHFWLNDAKLRAML